MDEPTETTETTEPTEPTTEPSGRPHRWILAGVAVLVLAADIATKQAAVAHWADAPVEVAGGWVRLTESRNPGAAFGIATGATPVLATLALAAALALVVFSGRLLGRPSSAIAGLALGGIVGNLVDRVFRAPGIFRGHVVDWIDIGSWPNFNLADSALVTACLLFVVVSVCAGPTDRTPTPKTAARSASGEPGD